MFHDPETMHRIARGAREEQIARARWRHELHDAGIEIGPRGEVARVLRGLANRIDDSPSERAPAAAEWRESAT
ncbi:MAG: hypothetical protein WD557_06440 [Dehalococcoidia bacterium]